MPWSLSASCGHSVHPGWAEGQDGEVGRMARMPLLPPPLPPPPSSTYFFVTLLTHPHRPGHAHHSHVHILWRGGAAASERKGQRAGAESCSGYWHGGWCIEGRALRRARSFSAICRPLLPPRQVYYTASNGETATSTTDAVGNEFFRMTLSNVRFLV